MVTYFSRSDLNFSFPPGSQGAVVREFFFADVTLTGGQGADTFHAGAGVDRVTDFSQADHDVVQVAPGAHYTVAQSGADTVVDLGAGDQLILMGVQMSSLTPGWIVEG